MDEKIAGVDNNEHENENEDEHNDNEDHIPEISSDDETEQTEATRRSSRISKPVKNYTPNMRGQSYEENNLITQMIKRSEYDNEYALLIARTICEL